jgi:hypothetical protein
MAEVVLTAERHRMTRRARLRQQMGWPMGGLTNHVERRTPGFAPLRTVSNVLDGKDRAAYPMGKFQL